jgi:uncharacterized membrane protein
MRWETSTEIDAPASLVWALTVDVAAWPTFTPTMQRVERLDDGPFGAGSSARIKQPGLAAAVWTVTRFEPGRSFSWQTSRMGLTMTGSHLVTHRPGRAAGEGCVNTLSIELTGRGSRLFWLLLGPLLRRSIVTENAGFKQKAEQLRASA